MNTRLLYPLLSLSIGIAVGWALKPQAPAASPPPGQMASAPMRSTTGSRPESGTRDTPAPRPAAASSREEDPAAAAQYASWRRKSLQQASAQREQARVFRLGEALGLNEDQLASVQGLLGQLRTQSQQSARAGTASTGDPMLALQQQAADFDAKLRALLTPEQQQRLDDYQQRKVANRAEARACSEMAELLQRVDLNATQFEQAFEVLRRKAQKDYASVSPALATVLDARGVQFSGLAGDTSISAFAASQAGQPGANSARTMYESMVERQRLLAGDRISRMAGIFSPAQLGQFRSALEESVTRMEQSLPADSPVHKGSSVTLPVTPEPPPEPEPDAAPE